MPGRPLQPKPSGQLWPEWLIPIPNSRIRIAIPSVRVRSTPHEKENPTMSARNLSLLLLTSLSLASAQVKQSARQLVPMGSGQLENAAQATGDFQSPNALGNEVKQELPLEKPILRPLRAAPTRTFAVPVAPGKADA